MQPDGPGEAAEAAEADHQLQLEAAILEAYSTQRPRAQAQGLGAGVGAPGPPPPGGARDSGGGGGQKGGGSFADRERRLRQGAGSSSGAAGVPQHMRKRGHSRVGSGNIAAFFDEDAFSKMDLSKRGDTDNPDYKEDECPICLEIYTAENPAIVTQCKHKFHLSCLYEWVERSDTCAVCLTPIVSDDLF